MAYPKLFDILILPASRDSSKENTLCLSVKYTVGYFKSDDLGTSLAIQWLRLHASTTGGMVGSLVRELRSRMPRGAAIKG